MKKYFRNSKRPHVTLKNLIFELKNTNICPNRKELLQRLTYTIKDLNFFEFSNLDKAIINIFIFHKISKKDYFTITDINCNNFYNDLSYNLRYILNEFDDKSYKKEKVLRLLYAESKTESGREFLNSLEDNNDFITILKYCEI